MGLVLVCLFVLKEGLTPQLSLFSNSQSPQLSIPTAKNWDAGI